jgi:hypothetical protein
MSQLAPAIAPAYTPTCLSKIQAVGIIIPARNHSESLLNSIASIFAANSHSGWHQSLWIVVVVDACSDDTAKAAREALGAFGQVLEDSTTCKRHIESARASSWNTIATCHATRFY